MLQQLLVIDNDEAANDDFFDSDPPPAAPTTGNSNSWFSAWDEYQERMENLLAQQYQMAMQAQEDCQ